MRVGILGTGSVGRALAEGFAGASHDVPGHGLGLNLARELVRLHGGELRLVRSDGEWTEFSALFRAAVPAAAEPSRVAT